MTETLELIKAETRGTNYEGKLYLVGGIVRDKFLGLPESDDVDIVLQGDATELAAFLFNTRIADHAPVVFTRFGTAMITVAGRQVELVGARSESYAPESRKPEVEFATLEQDVLRRDFTINTLLENLHTGEVLDLTGLARQDIEDGLIRTPTDPMTTFEDDPLRMLRAIRFASRFGFRIEDRTYHSIRDKAPRLSIISAERIRDEFSKMLMAPSRGSAMEMLQVSGLLSEFAPELVGMCGVTQNVYHLYDVWTHTMKALEAVPEDSDLCLRLAALFHDVGKPATRSVDEHGQVHFYTHHMIGAEMTRKVLSRLRFPNETIDRVVKIVFMHLRVGEYESEWTDAAIRRLIRDSGPDLEALITLTEADKAASNTAMRSADLNELQRRICDAQSRMDVIAIHSPLNGSEIMQLLGIEGGPVVREVKNFLVNEIIEGRLDPEDKDQSARIVTERWGG